MDPINHKNVSNDFKREEEKMIYIYRKIETVKKTKKDKPDFNLVFDFFNY